MGGDDGAVLKFNVGKEALVSLDETSGNERLVKFHRKVRLDGDQVRFGDSIILLTGEAV